MNSPLLKSRLFNLRSCIAFQDRIDKKCCETSNNIIHFIKLTPQGARGGKSTRQKIKGNIIVLRTKVL